MIELKGITKRFAATTALDHVSIQMDLGSRVVVVGESGAGKSTLLRCLAGLESWDSGELYWNSKPIAQGHLVRQPNMQISLLTQDYSVYPHLTVDRNLRVSMQSLALSTHDQLLRLQEVVERFELGALLNRRPAELSGGQLQRVALAKTLIRRPTLLLLDEPFSQLDPSLRDQCRAAVLAIVEQCNAILVMVTHDPFDALRMATHLVVLADGKVLQQDQPQMVYASPGDRRVAQLTSPFGLSEVAVQLPDQRQRVIVFRPEAVQVGIVPDSIDADTIAFSGCIQRTEFIGFARLATVAIHHCSLGKLVHRAEVKVLQEAAANTRETELRFWLRRESVLLDH